MPEARLTRQLPDGTVVPWQLNDADVPAGDALPTDPVSDAVVRSRLQTILTSGVPLTQATLDALETISLDPAQITDLKNVAVTNFPTSTEIANDVGNPIPVASPIRDALLDYAERTDGNPVYVGDAIPGTLTSSPGWNVLRLEYDVNNRLIRKRVRLNISWDNRTVGW